MDTKHIHCMLEKMAEYGKCMIEEGAGNGNVSLEEAGKIVDMVKDLAEAEKDALIAKEMRKEHEESESEEKYFLKMLKEEKEEEYKKMKDEYGDDEGERRFYNNYRYANGRFAPKGRGTRRGYEEPPFYHMTPDMYKEHDPEYYRDMDKKDGKMYYTETGMSRNTGSYNRTGSTSMRDSREGRSGMSRRGYMEAKELHSSNTPEAKQAKMKELEKYMSELGVDISEMISGASNEEKTMLKAKLQTLMQKIQ